MLRSFVRTLRFLGLMAGFVAALSLVSCSKKKIVVEPITGLEGVPSASQLIVYPDVPLRTYVFLDTAYEDTVTHARFRAVCSEDDSLLGLAEEQQATSSTVHGFIFDYTDASAFQMFSQDGAGFRLLKDYVLEPVKRYPFGLADVYTFDDPRAAAAALHAYVGRGVVNGEITPNSPLTNVGQVTVTPTASILYTGRTNICGDVPAQGEAPPDSLLPMSWTSVPAAAGYWVHIYQFGTGADFLSSRYPSPAFVGRSVDFFLAYFPGPVTAYKIGDPLPAGSRILTQRALLNNADYAVRITAVNSEGQLIAYPSEASRAFFFIRDADAETHYALRTLGAFVVHTGNTSTCPTNPPCPQAVGTQLPNVKVYSQAGLPPALRP